MSDADFRSALRGGRTTLAGSLVGRVLAAAAALAVAGLLGARDYGSLNLAWSTALVITSVTALGLPVAVMKLVSGHRVADAGRVPDLIGAAVAIAGISGVAGALALAGSSAWVAADVLGRPSVATALLAAAPLVLLTPLAELQLSVLTGLEQFAVVARLRVLRGALNAAALLSAAAGVGVAGVFVLMSASELVSCLVASRVLRRRGGVRLGRRAVGDWWRPLLRVSIPATAAGLAIVPALYVGQLLLSRQRDGLRLVGIFNVAYRYHALALFVPAAMGAVLLPMLGRLGASHGRSVSRALFRRYTAMTLAMTIPASLVLALLAGPLMGLQGAQYRVGTSTLVVLSLAVVPAALNTGLGQLAVAEGRLRVWVVSDVVLAVVFVAAAAVLVPRQGTDGLALSFCAGYLATCVALLPLFTNGNRDAE